MTVLPLYCMMWQDLPTSIPPPKHKNMNSSAGSTGSSISGDMAESFLFPAMLLASMNAFQINGQGGLREELDRMERSPVEFQKPLIACQ